MNEIPLSVPNLNIDILDNLRECIETGWVSTGGRFITEFEEKLAKYVGVSDAVSTQSGTAGLHLSLIAAGVVAGDEVIVPTLTFIAAVNPVKYMGAEPIFMDCDDSLCMDAEKLESFFVQSCMLTDDGLINNLTKKKISAIVVVHVFGNMVNMEQIMNIAQKYRVAVIEDATEALGTYYTSGQYSGQFAGTVGDFGVYSFNANKIITTGGGGMVVAKEQKHLDKIRYLSVTAKDDALYFVHNEVGYNYRMLNIQAALGVSQIDELEKFIEIKRGNYELYKEQLQNVVGIEVLPFNHNIRPNYWFYSILVDEVKYVLNRDALMKKLFDSNVQCRPVWKLISEQKPYVSSLSVDIIKAKEYEKIVLNVPCSTNLKHEQIQRICDIIISAQKIPGGNFSNV
jgi:aminotransferase in exopolysaccharide biosynthesis